MKRQNGLNRVNTFNFNRVSVNIQVLLHHECFHPNALVRCNVLR